MVGGEWPLPRWRSGGRGVVRASARALVRRGKEKRSSAAVRCSMAGVVQSSGVHARVAFCLDEEEARGARVVDGGRGCAWLRNSSYARTVVFRIGAAAAAAAAATADADATASFTCHSRTRRGERLACVLVL